MTKIKLLTSLSGPIGAFVPGDVIKVDEAEAARFIERGLAVLDTAIPAPVAPVEVEPVASVHKRRKHKA
jgi:hypothetical protein